MLTNVAVRLGTENKIYLAIIINHSTSLVFVGYGYTAGCNLLYLGIYNNIQINLVGRLKLTTTILVFPLPHPTPLKTFSFHTPVLTPMWNRMLAESDAQNLANVKINNLKTFCYLKNQRRRSSKINAKSYVYELL